MLSCNYHQLYNPGSETTDKCATKVKIIYSLFSVVYLSSVEGVTEDEETVVAELETTLAAQTESEEDEVENVGDVAAVPIPLVAHPRLEETLVERRERKQRYVDAGLRSASQHPAQRDIERERLEVEFEREQKRIDKERQAAERRQEKRIRATQDKLQAVRKRQAVQATRIARRRRIQACLGEARAAVRERQETRRRLQQEAEKRWSKRMMEKRKRVERRRKAKEKLRKKYGGQNDENGDARMRMDARKEMDKRMTPRNLPLPRRGDPLSDTHGLSLSQEMLEYIYEQREGFIGQDSVTIYSDGSLMEAGTDSVSMAFGVVF
ncbi:hypothetical protein BC939DRAFT_80924 [Gamsiella multidivaricata]|uniref:uncharacterized protein n=1 Tax=Gamsiella multidivaricata TaxID=101098 RepID=UPI002220A454|nr:uncharacterized protein BC939DRAFT_80924 [Gamsiella multidivaricata]KAI7815878.1 hypothetical protein BC939DRAFT_80924 [Gamsiella multidivaricata]